MIGNLFCRSDAKMAAFGGFGGGCSLACNSKSRLPPGLIFGQNVYGGLLETRLGENWVKMGPKCPNLADKDCRLFVYIEKMTKNDFWGFFRSIGLIFWTIYKCYIPLESSWRALQSWLCNCNQLPEQC